MKEFKTIRINKESYDKFKFLSKKTNKTMNEIFSTMIDFSLKNNSILFKKNSEDSDSTNDILKEILSKLKFIYTKEINRIIGFIVTQDEYLRTLKRDILFKIDSNQDEEYHPLFEEYDFYIGLLEKVFESKNISHDNIVKTIEEIYGKQKVKFFTEAEYKIKNKKLVI